MQTYICELADLKIPFLKELDPLSYKLLNLHSNRQSFFNTFIQIVRYEDRTLHLLVKTIKEMGMEEGSYAVYEDSKDPNMISNSFPIGDIEEELRNNYIIGNLIGSEISGMSLNEIVNFLIPLLNYVQKNGANMGDVYDKDIDHLAGRSNMQRVIVLMNGDNEYNGHIYHYYNTKNTAVFIGIRSSLLNIARRLYLREYTRNVSYYLIDACVEMVKIFMPGTKTIELEFPIGSMGAISQKFGFNEDYKFKVTDKPLVKIGDYKIVYFRT